MLSQYYPAPDTIKSSTITWH